MITVPVVVFMAGLVLVACGAAGHRVWVGLPPPGAARLMMAGLLIAVMFTYLSLALMAGPLLLGALPPSALAAACRRQLARLDPGVPGVTWLAVALLAASVCAVAGRARRCRHERRGLRVEHEVGSHEYGPEFELVTLPSEMPVAYSLGGRWPQVVVSQGLRDRLDGSGFAAVVAHEAAHLRARHDRWLVLATLLETALWFVPWARRATGTLRLSLERWADEDAARTVGRVAVRAGLLAAVDAAPLPSSAAALSRAGALAERLAMLVEEPPGRGGAVSRAGFGRFTVMAVAAVVTVGGLVASLSMLAHLCTA